MEPRNFDPGALIEEMGWLRGLAASLVGDAGGAEDVAQDALVAALERRPWSGGSGSLRPWLAAVARKIVLRRRRDAPVHASVELPAALSHGSADTAAIVERVELHRRLAEVVLGLEEPYRSAVVLRYFEGASAEEIAARQACTREAARQRVSRALSMLRARLDRSFGDRTRWLAAFAPLATHAATAGAAAVGGVTIGGLIMGMKGVGVAVAAVVLAMVSWIGLRTAVEGNDSRERVEPPTPVSEISSRSGVPGTAPGESAIEAAAEAGSPRRETIAPAESSVGGIVVDRRGEPIAGARVRLERDGHSLDSTPARETDESGRFEWRIGATEFTQAELAVVAEHPEYFPATTRAAPASPCELVLTARPLVVGRLRTPDDRPIGGVTEVTLSYTVAGSDRPVLGETECLPDGGFRSFGLERGRLIGVNGRAKGFARTWRAFDEPLIEEGRVEVEVVLEQGAVARGIVLDARTKRPIPGATVFAELFRHDQAACAPSSVTDAQGRFELIGLHVADVIERNAQNPGTLGVVPIGAEAPGYAPANEMVVPIQLDQVFEDVEILLEPAGGRVVGRVSSSAGNPVEGMGVYLFDSSDNTLFHSSDPDGRFQFEGVPEGAFTVFAFDADCPVEERAWARTDDEILAGGLRELEIVLAPATAVMEGRILEPGGEPVAGARVDLRWSVQTDDWIRQLRSWIGSTDDEGRFRFEHLYPGRIEVIHVGFEGQLDLALDSSTSARWIEAGEHLSGIEVVAAEPVAIHGRVDRAREKGWEIELRDAASGRTLTRTRSAPDGSFQLAGLFPTDFDVVVLEEGTDLAHVSVGPEGANDVLVSVP